MSVYYRFINLQDYEEFNFVVFVSDKEVPLADITAALEIAWQRYIELAPIPSRQEALKNKTESYKELGERYPDWSRDKVPGESDVDHELDYLIKIHHQAFCYPFPCQSGTGNEQDWVIRAFCSDDQTVSNIGPSLILEELRKLGLSLVEYTGGDLTFNRELV